MAETAVTAIVSALGGVGAAVGGMAAYLRVRGKAPNGSASSLRTLEELRRENATQHAAVLATAERIQQSLETHMINEREYQVATLATLGEIGRGIAVLLDRPRP